MAYDVRTRKVTASSMVIYGMARVHAVYVLDGSSAGTVQLTDAVNGTSGEMRETFDTPGINSGIIQFLLSGVGSRFINGIYATLTNVSSAVVEYDGGSPYLASMSFNGYPVNSGLLALL